MAGIVYLSQSFFIFVSWNLFSEWMSDVISISILAFCGIPVLGGRTATITMR